MITELINRYNIENSHDNYVKRYYVNHELKSVKEIVNFGGYMRVYGPKDTEGRVTQGFSRKILERYRLFKLINTNQNSINIIGGCYDWSPMNKQY